jgi:hypothetical protein
MDRERQAFKEPRRLDRNKFSEQVRKFDVLQEKALSLNKELQMSHQIAEKLKESHMQKCLDENVLFREISELKSTVTELRSLNQEVLRPLTPRPKWRTLDFDWDEESVHMTATQLADKQQRLTDVEVAQQKRKRPKGSGKEGEWNFTDAKRMVVIKEKKADKKGSKKGGRAASPKKSDKRGKLGKKVDKEKMHTPLPSPPESVAPSVAATPTGSQASGEIKLFDMSLEETRDAEVHTHEQIALFILSSFALLFALAYHLSLHFLNYFDPARSWSCCTQICGCMLTSQYRRNLAAPAQRWRQSCITLFCVCVARKKWSRSARSISSSYCRPGPRSLRSNSTSRRWWWWAHWTTRTWTRHATRTPAPTSSSWGIPFLFTGIS